jgi:hypothetical protein
MSSLADVFRILEQMCADRVLSGYAVGGATAVLFYAEPTRTYDVDVFVRLPPEQQDNLTPLSTVYEWAGRHGIRAEAEHLMIEGVPVQLLPAYSPLVEEAITAARVHDYDGVPVHVVGPEHLVALALMAGGARRRERAWQLLETGTVDRQQLKAMLTRHGITAVIPDDV